MSKNDKEVSEKALVEPKNNSVYDFLYCDTKRIASFLAQFDNSGVIEKIIQRESVSKGTGAAIEVSLGGGASIAGTGGTGNFGIKRVPQERGSEASERIYDTLWANPLLFLDFLTAANLIAPDLTAAGMGQFVKVTGSLRVVDFSILKQIFEEPILRKKAISSIGSNEGNRHERRKAETSGNPKVNDVEVGITLLTIFATTTQATMIDTQSGQSVWCSLRDDALVVASGDLLLQHGLEIAGQWTMIGILDAQAATDVGVVRKYGSPFIDALASLTPIVKEGLGRPKSSFGVTPLLILREVSH